MKNTRNCTSWGKKLAALLLACATLALCACGNLLGGPQDSAEAPASASSSASAATEKQAGGDLFIAMPADTGSLDPLTAADEDLVNLLTLIYEPAVRVNANGQPEPCLIESWEADESGRVYTFKVRQDVFFADGSTPLTAEDIVYSAKQVGALTGAQFDAPVPVEPNPEGTQDPNAQEGTQDPDNPEGTPGADSSTEASSSAETSQTESSDPGAGSTESPTIEIPQTNRYAQYNSLVESIEVVDSATVKLTMTKPGVEALYFMSFPVMNEALHAGGQTVGTGPYRIESFDASTEMVLTANGAWWNGQPNIPTIVARPMTGSTAKLEAVSTSILDFITTDVLYAGKYKIAGKTQVIDYMTNYYDCLLPNLGNSTLGITEVRQAISYAIDRRELISTVLMGHGVPANMPISPDFYAYDSKYNQDEDLKTARALLESAGYRSSMDGTGNALRFTIIVPDDREMSYRIEAAKAIKKQLEGVGIEITVEELNQQEYYDRLQAKNFELALCSFYLDEDPDISFLFNPGGSANYGGVDNAEITAAIDAARSAFAEEAIKTNYSELQRLLTERVPQIGLYYRMNSIVCSELLTGVGSPRQGEVFAQVNEWYYKKS